MITKGILKTIDYNENSCTVRLPLFESAAASGEVVLPAIFITQPGSFNGYNEGDVVFVDFENNSLTSPVVIGKLYLGAAKELANPKKGGLAVADLTVTSTASLPLDTKLVLDKSALSTVSVDNGLDTYKSILDIIKALHKTTTSMDKVTEDSLESITTIKVEYLSQAVGLAAPLVEDLNWSSSIPAYKEGYEIWQKTTCYNRRNQILGEPEIICLSSATSTASYWLKCSTRIHSGTNQATNIKIKALVKLGSNLETLDAEVILKYKWADDPDWSTTKGSTKPYELVIEPINCKDEDLIVEAWRPGATEAYESETITFAPKNTPVLDLDNDSASIAYDSRGTNKLNWNDSVSSSAAVYFNGEQVEIPAENFTWTLTNCKVKGSDNTTFKTNTIVIYEIVDTDTATAECAINYNGVELKKTFTITKVRQGTSSYKLDINNDFVSVITGSNGVISWNEASWEANTAHTINIYYGDKLETKSIRIIDSETELSDDSGLCLVYTTNNVVLKNIETSYITAGTINLSLSSLSEYSDTGDIKYQLFNNLNLLASAKFEFTRIRSGSSAASYWLKLSANSHLGTEQPDSKPLSVVAMTKNGTETETEDLEAILWWRLPNVKDPQWTKTIGNEIITGIDPNGTEIKGYTYNSLFFDAEYIANNIGNNSIEIIATHNSEFIPDEDTDFLDTNIYEEELIEYAPRNTPILTLTNDSDALSYNYLGQCLDLDSATTTAQVVLNGDNVAGAVYTWTFNSIDNEGNITTLTDLDTVDTKITKTNNTIVVHKIPSSKLEAVCTATYTWDGQSSTMTKVFTIVRQVQGEAAVSHWLKLDSFIHIGENQKTDITITAKKKVGVDGAERTDTTAVLYIYKKEGTSSSLIGTSNTGIYTIEVKDFENADYEIKATHNKDNIEVLLDEDFYDSETITYSPLNTPIIDLSNDTAILSYKNSSQKVLDSDVVATTATLYLNGDPLAATYSWTFSSCTGVTSTDNFLNDTATISALATNSNSATATVTARVTENGAFKDKTYTKDFKITKVLKGIDANSYWLKCSSYIHTGTNQTEDLTITAMTQEGTNTETEDTTARLFYKWDTDTSWNPSTTAPTYEIVISKADIKEANLLIKATHDSGIDHNTIKDATLEKIYDEETITYSPLNTPVIDLDNDSAALNYTSEGTKIEATDKVSSTATLYLNGKVITTASYIWYLENCTTDITATTNNTHLIADTISINNLTANNGTATCLAFKDKDIKAVVIRAGWTEENWIRYSTDTAETWTGSTAINAGEYFVIVGRATDSKKLHIILSQATSNNNGEISGGAVSYDEAFTKVFSISKQIKGADGATAVMYKAHVSSETIAWSKTSYTPSSIDVYLEKIEGSTTTKVATYISYSVNGGSFQKDVSITKTPYIKSSWGMAAITSSLVLKFYLSSADRKNDENIVDQITITAIHDGQDGGSSEIQYAFLWSDNYLYDINKNLPLVNLANTAASKETWFIRSLTDAPEIKETRKIIFISSRSGIGNDITNIPWSKPEVFAVASEKAYQILKTSEGLFGYGQGVYYTVASTVTFNNKTFTAGEKYTPEDLAAYAAESEDNRNNIKVYISAEYIKTGALTVGNESNPLFQAGLDNETVKIAGFDVVGKTLTAGQNTNKVSIGTDSIYLGGANFEQAPFGVTKEGALKAASGEIGGFKLTESEFKITSLDNLGYTQADFLITNTDQEGKLDGGTKYYKAGGRTGTDWRLIVGQLFGVNNEGKLFAQDATIEGTLIGKQGNLENMTSITAEDIYCNSNLNCNNISLGGSGATITTVTESGSTSKETIYLKLSADQPAPTYIGGNWLFSVKFETRDGEKVAKRCNTGYKLAWATFSCSVDKASGSGTVQDKIFNKVYFSNAAIILSADHTYETNTTSAGGGGAPYPASWTLEEVCVVNSTNNMVSLEDLSVDNVEIYKNTVTTNIMFNCGVEAPTMIAEAFYATSDKRLKENIKEYVPQKSILDLPVVEFDFKESGAHQIGCIAQDLQEICPELVTTNVEGYLTISENKLVYLLLEEVKKLNSKVIELEQTLKSERTK